MAFSGIIFVGFFLRCISRSALASFPAFILP